MNIKIKRISTLTEIEAQRINVFLKEHTDGNFFQSPSCYNFYCNLIDYESIYLVALDGQNVAGILLSIIQKEHGIIRSKVTSRCVIYGGPIVVNDDSIIAALLIKELVEVVQDRTVFIEFRNLFDTSRIKTAFKKHNFRYEKHLNYLLRIDNENQILNRIKREKRRQIKRVLENGLELRPASSLDEIKKFYEILENIYLKKVKKPLPDLSFFENFYEEKLGVILLVKAEDKIIAGSACPIWDNKIIYDWYRAGLDFEFKNLLPSTMAVWAIIQYALKNNIKIFDFLGAGKPDEKYGVREFKSQFGGKEVEYGRYLKINKRIIYKLGQIAINTIIRIKS